MADIPGKDVTLFIEDSPGAGTFTKIAKATVHRLTIANSEIEVSHKDSGGFRDLFPEGAIKSAQMTMSVLYDASATQATIFTTAMSTTNPAATFQFKDGSGKRLVGEFQLSNVELGGETEGFAGADVTMSSNGVFVWENDT
jgi:TP901-1 family phage major tail protein